MTSMRCLACGEGVDDFTPTEEGAKPSPGAVAICFYCAHVMVYDEDLRYRDMTPEERRTALTHPTILQLQRMVLERKRRLEAENAVQDE